MLKLEVGKIYQILVEDDEQFWSFFTEDGKTVVNIYKDITLILVEISPLDKYNRVKLKFMHDNKLLTTDFWVGEDDKYIKEIKC